ncbi:MAG: LURP-one-related/scramblase family protein [Acutalibacteraceae bacterium]
MIFYLKEEFLSFDHFDIWDENENLVYSADREFFNFGKKLIVQDASGRQVAAVQHVPFSLPCTYALTIGGREYDLTRNFAFFSRSYSLDELGWEIEGDFHESGLRDHAKRPPRRGHCPARFLTLGDRYALEVFDPQDALIALCTVLAIDCCDEEHSR